MLVPSRNHFLTGTIVPPLGIPPGDLQQAGLDRRTVSYDLQPCRSHSFRKPSAPGTGSHIADSRMPAQPDIPHSICIQSYTSVPDTPLQYDSHHPFYKSVCKFLCHIARYSNIPDRWRKSDGTRSQCTTFHQCNPDSPYTAKPAHGCNRSSPSDSEPFR